MKKQITLIALAAVSTAVSANAQDFIAGWDFSGINVGSFGTSLGTTVNGAQSDFAAILVDDANGLPQVVSRGKAPDAGTFRANNGFDNNGTRSYSDFVPTGQQGLEFGGYDGNFSFTVDFGGTVDNAIIDFDWVVNGLGVGSDLISVEYTAGGQTTGYQGTTPGFLGSGADEYLAASNTSWTSSESFVFGNPAFGSPSIDLSGVAGVESVTFTIDGAVLGAGNLLAFDNISVQGGNFTPVPEPSTYAAIAGALALAFVAYRRRK